ncbi:MAG: EamA family transporter [Thermoanaerobaculia bacterium]
MAQLSHALAVLSSVSYGAADFLGGLATKRGSNVFSVVAFSQLVGLILVGLCLPFLPSSAPSAADLAWGAAAGLAGGVGVGLLYRGLAVGMMSVVAPVTAVCAVIIPVAVGVAFGERLTRPAGLGVVLAIVAIVLISQSGDRQDGRRATTGLPVAIASGVAIGVFLVCLERTAPAAGLWPLIPARIVSVSLFAAAGMVLRNALLPRRGAMRIVVAGGVLDMAANVLYLLAVREGPLGIVATLTSLYPASTVLLARIVLHERLRRVQQAGVACAAAAILLIVAF